MTARLRGRRANALVEAAMLIPLLTYFFMGTVEFARIGYTYYSLQKILYNFARFAATRQALDFCAESDTSLTQARNFAITGTTDASAEPLLPNLTTDALQIRIERVDADSGELVECECANTGCDLTNGGRGPDFVAVRLADGYPVQIRIPFLGSDPIVLRPQVRIPYGGS